MQERWMIHMQMLSTTSQGVWQHMTSLPRPKRDPFPLSWKMAWGSPSAKINQPCHNQYQDTCLPKASIKSMLWETQTKLNQVPIPQFGPNKKADPATKQQPPARIQFCYILFPWCQITETVDFSWRSDSLVDYIKFSMTVLCDKLYVF